MRVRALEMLGGVLAGLVLFAAAMAGAIVFERLAGPGAPAAIHGPAEARR